jgi:hypothetical protein
MDGACNELLARAGLADDEHRRSSGSDELDASAQVAHRRAVPDQLLGPGRERFSGGRWALRAHARHHRLINDAPELDGVTGLREILESAALDGLHGRSDRPLRGHQDHWQVGLDASEPGHQLDAIHACHADVADDGVKLVLATGGDRRFTVCSELASASFRRESVRNTTRHLGVVVDHENESILHLCSPPGAIEGYRESRKSGLRNAYPHAATCRCIVQRNRPGRLSTLQ